MSRRSSSQVGDQKNDDARSEYPSPPEIPHNPAERGRELGEENAYGGHSVGTGGHGNRSGCSSRQRVGGEHYTDISQFTQEKQHPGMSPDYAERGRELGEANAYGGHSVGTGGHGKESGCSSRQRVGGEHYKDISQSTQEQKHPGMNPDYAERGRELGEENAYGGHSVGTGGHGNKSGCSSRQRVGGEHYKDISQFTQEQQHPGMNSDYAERGRELGEENAYGGHSVGTGGHGKESGCSSRQRVGGEHYTDISQFTQEQKHPGMNPDYAERGRQLGEENACGGHSVGTGGHGNKSGYSKLTSTYQGFFEFQCDYDFRQLTVCWW
ncbi:unnamed protein product [Rotaria sp. Silwood2]|nr:unnamed protein product [Rotaria sp. Silwood2]